MAYETLRMTKWNCNGSLRTNARYFEGTFKNTDLLAMLKTINALLVNSPMYNDIDGSHYVVPNYKYHDALEPPGEWLSCTKRCSITSMIE